MRNQVYFWQDESGAWQLARRVNDFFRWLYIGRTATGDKYDTEWLMQHLYSNDIEWVPTSKLQPYYGDNQPEGK